MLSQPVNNCVTDLRKARGETQQDLAQAVGVTRQTIIAIERGNYTPSVLLALQLAKHFHVTVEDIFSIE